MASRKKSLQHISLAKQSFLPNSRLRATSFALLQGSLPEQTGDQDDTSNIVYKKVMSDFT
jgi:hypothetical protein